MGDEAKFGVKITGDASSLVDASKQANEALTDTGKSAQEAGKKVEEGGKIATHAAGQHRDLRFAVKGLQDAFPELAHVAHMALHPIALVVAAVGVAWTILKTRVEEATRAMSEAKLPDISPEKIGQVTALAEAWRNYQAALEGAVKAYNSVEGASERVIKKIEGEAEEQKKLLAARKGLELADLEQKKSTLSKSDYERRKLDIEDRYEQAGIRADQRKKEEVIYARQDEAQALRRDAAIKFKESKGIRVGTAEQDAQTEADLKGRADAAQKDIEEHRKQIGNYRALQAGEGNPLERVKWRWQLNMALGQTLGTTPSDQDFERAISGERTPMLSEQANVDRYNAWMGNKAAREEARRRKFGLIGEAGAEMGKASVLDAESGEEMGAASQEFSVNRRVGAMDNVARSKQAAGRANDNVQQAVNDLIKVGQSGHEITSEALDRIKELKQVAADLSQRVRDLEGRPPRI